MKTLDIARKDLLRSFRSVSFVGMGFAIPLLVSGIFYFAFGGLSGEEGFSVPRTSVQLVNLDEPVPGLAGFSAGQTIVDILGSDDLAELVELTVVADAESARAAVDRQEAGVALILPAGLTQAALGAGQEATIEAYQDPTLSIGPGIITGIVKRALDGFSGSKIAADVSARQLASRGRAVNQHTFMLIALNYGIWAETLEGESQSGDGALVEVRSPFGEGEEQTDLRTGIISTIMAGMMVFYVYYTGALSAHTLLQEEEGGTLGRLFTTPTRTGSILGGRLIATLVTLVLQVAVLLVLSALVFGIDWGPPLPVVLVALVLVVTAASLGLCLSSLIKDTRQAGLVFGGVLTLAGMVGMMGIFAANVGGSAKEAVGIVSLLVPQGWGVKAWQLLLEGGGVRDVAWTLLVTLALAAVFFGIGLLRFRKRFA